jgi:tetratricopeptide (TPR) repeat protein/transcriptional regulator with XRE-family HTH domain
VANQPARDFAELLQQLRAESGLTQEELAQVSGLSPRTVSDLERGIHRSAHQDTARLLADALGLAGPARGLFVAAARGKVPVADVLAARQDSPAGPPPAATTPAGPPPAPAAPVPGPPGPAASAPAAPVPAPLVPRELPADVSGFTGRALELAELDLLLPEAAEQPGRVTGPVVISAVSGTAGVGKTTLAVRWAHRAQDAFPDGQLYVNLRGYDPERPVPAAEALAGFLRALGMADQNIPQGEAERSARYRSLLAGQRLLVVLDNAASEAQVRPLLPGSGSVMVLVTSRGSLPGLVARDGATRLDLDLLPMAEAVALLRTLIGRRAEAEPAAAEALAKLCARLPLALRVAAELAASRPDTPLAELATDLAGQGKRLDLLDAGGDPRSAVASVFSWSYWNLPEGAARLFRLLGWHPAADWDRHAAAALAGTSLPEASQQLGALAQAHLIQPAGPGRFGLHDLLREYAAGLAATHDGDQAARTALTRLFDYYLAASAAAMDRLDPAERHHRPDPPQTAVPVPGLADGAAARAWLDAELATLTAVAAHAAEHGWPGHTIRLASTLHRYLHGGHDIEGLTICTLALDAARGCGDRAAQAGLLASLGVFHGRRGHYEQAIDCHREALALARDAGDRLTQARALGNLALAHDEQGRYQESARCQSQALALYRELGDMTGEAISLSNLGLVYLRQGRYQEAAGHMQQAIGLYHQLDHRFGEAIALTNFGEVCYRQGRYQQAADHQAQALALARELGDRRVAAWALTRLGQVGYRQGRYDQAADSHQQALALFRDIGDLEGETDALNGAGETLLAAGQPDQAGACHAAALDLTSQTGNQRERARALTRLGEICHRQGDDDQAAGRYQEALALYRLIGDRGGEADALNSAGEALVGTGQPVQARSCHTAALALARRTGDRYQQARAHHGLAEASDDTALYDQARRHRRQALDIYAALGVPEASQLSASP